MRKRIKKNEFRAMPARKEISIGKIAKALGIDPSTLSRKIFGQSDFYRNEIEKICRILELPPQMKRCRFFLSNDLLLRNISTSAAAGGETVETDF